MSTPGPLVGTPGYEANPFMTNPVLVDDNYLITNKTNSNEAEELEDLSPKSPGSMEGIEREKERKLEDNLTGEREVQDMSREIEPSTSAYKYVNILSVTNLIDTFKLLHSVFDLV